MATVAIQDSFLDSFARLPRKVQAKVSTFLVKFRNDPHANGINYEKINAAADAKMWSVRIDNTYRGIVARDDAADVYILLWVDHHDEAYEWARRKHVEVNPATGALQVYETVEVEPPAEEVATAQGAGSGGAVEVAAQPAADATAEQPVLPLGGISDDDLLYLGVPADLLDYVRGLDAAAFSEARGRIPIDAYENLSWLFEGFSLSEVLELVRSERSDAGTAATGTSDLAASLENPQTQRSFTVVEGEDELYAMLAAPLEKWRIFLHPSQRKVVARTFRGPARVLGGAGTGKTVVAMHRAKALAEKLQPGERLLFTTFNSTLALDISNNLASICSRDTMERIEVVNLDAWVSRFLKAEGFEFRIVYSDDELDALWESAVADAGVNLPFSAAFYRDEWAQVVVAQGIEDVAAYAHAKRTGRGRRLTRRERIEVWRVVEEYRRACKLGQVRDVDFAMWECEKLVRGMGEAPRYRHIVVDEGQDFSAAAYRLLRALAGPQHENDLFIVGDARQRIYGKKVVLSHCGIDVRGRSSILRINYRTTEEIRSRATRLLAGLSFDDLDGEVDDDARTESLTHGQAPVVHACATEDEEREFIVRTVRGCVDEGMDASKICVVARTKQLLDAYAQLLDEAGVDVYKLASGKADDRGRAGVRVATMHRVKGLEFDCIIMPGLTDVGIPPAAALRRARAEGREEELKAEERSLLYVALTRARVAAYLSYSGHPTPLLGAVG